MVALFTTGFYFFGPVRLGAELLFSAVELLIGLGLIGTNLSIRTQLLGIGTYLVLACGSGLKLAMGVENCGCFGRLETPPAVSFAIAIICLGILGRCSTIRAGENSKAPLFGYFLKLVAFSLIVAAWVRVGESHRKLGEEIHPGNAVVVTTADMIGKSFPLYSYVPNSAALREGTWQVLFYNEDCPKCQSLLSSLEDSAIDMAILEIPPFDAPPDFPDQSDPRRIWLRLDPRFRWIVEPGSQFKLVDGLVVE